MSRVSNGIDPLHQEFLTAISTDCDDEEIERLQDATRRLDAEMWFLRGRESAQRRYAAAFEDEDYGTAIVIHRERIWC